MFCTWARTTVARKLAPVQEAVPLRRVQELPGTLQVVPLHRVELAAVLQPEQV